MKIVIIFLSIFAITIPSQAQINWTLIPSGTDKNLKTIQFVDDLNGYIGGDSVLLRTSDGGANWTPVQIDSLTLVGLATLDIFDMHWFSVSHGIIMSGPWGGMLETWDAGSTWQAVAPANGGFCQFGSVFYFDENHGFAGGAGCFEGHIVDRFENGTWSTTADPADWDTQNLVVSIEFKDSLVGFAGTLNGTLLRTADGGLNWDTITNLAGDSTITDFIFYPDGTIRATHNNNAEYGVMISEDDGLTWEFDSELASFFYPSMDAAHIDDSGTTYIAGETFNGGLIFENSGAFWNMINLNYAINDIASHSDTLTFLVGDSGAIYARVDPGTLGVEDVSDSPNFHISPNPASVELNISGIEGRIDFLRVYGSSGKLLMQEAGTGLAQRLDVSSLDSGVFIIEIETDTRVERKTFVKR